MINMNFRRFFWPLVSLILIVLIYFNLGAVNFLQLNFNFFILSSVLFLLSTVFWSFSWAEIYKIKYWDAFKINSKSLAGIFSPMNLGGDALRAYFSKEKTKAVASSFIVKFFKFILMGILLIIGLCLISHELEFAGYFWTFIIMILLTFSGAFIVLAFTFPKIISFVNKFFKRRFVPQFRKSLLQYFIGLKFFQIVRIIFWLLISIFFEIIAVLFAFHAIGAEVSFLYAFVISSIINSLALVTITPQGIGFVEAGGYFVLKFSIFGLANSLIGTFLIIWNVIRIWIPSLIGLLLFWCGKK